MIDVYKSLKVLIIDDQKTLVWGIKKFLEERGFLVDEAFNGIQGEEKILSGNYDIVVIDLKLPEKSGLDVLSSVKGKVNSIFILISAFATAKDAERATKLGASDFIPKPFSPDELLERISLLLSSENTKKINTFLKWHTFFMLNGKIRADVFYENWENFYISSLESKGFFIANRINGFGKGVLHTAFEMARSMFDFEKYVFSNDDLSDVDIFTYDVEEKNCKFKGKVFFSKKFNGVLDEKKNKSDIFVVGFNFNNKEFEFLEKIDGNVFKKLFLLYCFLRKNFVKFENKILFIINLEGEGGYFKVQEKILPEFVSEEDISRFLFSIPPSQKIKEERKRELKLLACEIAAELRSQLRLQPLIISADYSVDGLKILFESEFLPLLPDLSNAEEKCKIVSLLLGNMLNEKRLFISEDRKRVELHLNKEAFKSEVVE